jgi:hypothetical protein
VKKPVIVAIGIAVALLALIVFSTFGERVRVEVCMEFQGQTVCKTNSATTRDLAIRSAIQNACGEVSSGVTQVMQCQNTPPKSITVK